MKIISASNPASGRLIAHTIPRTLHHAPMDDFLLVVEAGIKNGGFLNDWLLDRSKISQGHFNQKPWFMQ
jgi:hypothetical protein